MIRKSIQDLGELQRAIMEIVWELEEATAQEVLQRINTRRSKALAYTTVLSAMQKLERNGWLRHRRDGRSHVYRATQSREAEGQRSLKKFTQSVFQGDPLLLFEQLLRDQRLSAEDLKELQKLIRRRRKELDDE